MLGLLGLHKKRALTVALPSKPARQTPPRPTLPQFGTDRHRPITLLTSALKNDLNPPPLAPPSPDTLLCNHPPPGRLLASARNGVAPPLPTPQPSELGVGTMAATKRASANHDGPPQALVATPLPWKAVSLQDLPRIGFPHVRSRPHPTRLFPT